VHGFPLPNSDLDQVANFYRNLAVWLLPRDVRNELKLDLFFRLAVDPDVFEVRGSGFASLGRVARYALKVKWQLDDLHWLISYAESDHSKNLDELLSRLLLAEDEGGKLSATQTLILGAIVHAYHRDFAAQGAVTPDWLERRPNPVEMIKTGIDSVRTTDSSVADRLLSLLQNID
jgi:hypothetical protein